MSEYFTEGLLAMFSLVASHYRFPSTCGFYRLVALSPTGKPRLLVPFHLYLSLLVSYHLLAFPITDRQPSHLVHSLPEPRLFCPNTSGKEFWLESFPLSHKTTGSLPLVALLPTGFHLATGSLPTYTSCTYSVAFQHVPLRLAAFHWLPFTLATIQ